MHWLGRIGLVSVVERCAPLFLNLFAFLLLLLRKALVEKAVDFGLPKYGSAEELKKRLIGYWIATQSKLVEKEIAKDSEEAAAMPVAEDASAKGADAPDPTDTGAPDPANAGAPDPANAVAGPTSSAPGEVMFGRSTLSFGCQSVEDKTDYFADLGQAPEVKTEPENWTALFEAGLDGVVPVAALVKVLQGFQEEIQAQVAVLLSSFLFAERSLNTRSVQTKLMYVTRLFF